MYRLINKGDLNEQTIKQLYDVEVCSGGEPYNQDEFKSVVTHDTNVTFACFDGDNIVGIITCNTQSKKFGGSAYIVNLSVKKEYQRQGIATKLIYTTAKYIKDNLQLDKQITLEVDKTNLRAYNLYKKLGFALVKNYQDDEQYGMSANLQDLLNNLAHNV